MPVKLYDSVKARLAKVMIDAINEATTNDPDAAWAMVVRDDNGAELGSFPMLRDGDGVCGVGRFERAGHFGDALLRFGRIEIPIDLRMDKTYLSAGSMFHGQLTGDREDTAAVLATILGLVPDRPAAIGSASAKSWRELPAMF